MSVDKLLIFQNKLFTFKLIYKSQTFLYSSALYFFQLYKRDNR